MRVAATIAVLLVLTGAPGYALPEQTRMFWTVSAFAAGEAGEVEQPRVDPQLVHPFKFPPSIYDRLNTRPLPQAPPLDGFALQPPPRQFIPIARGSGVTSTRFNFLQFTNSLRRH